MKTVQTVCAYCGKTFEDHPTAKRKYCSHACYSKSKENKIQRTCEVCGKPFETLPGEIRRGNGKYCSRECFFAANQGAGNHSWKGGALILVCEQCHKEFSRDRTWPKSKGNLAFCSEPCRHAFMRANPDKTPNWKNGATFAAEGERKSWKTVAWRKAVYDRDNYTCQKCGKCGVKLQAHHLYRFAQYPELRFHVENGLTLCCDCHRQIKNHEREFLIQLGYDPDKPPFQLTLLPSWEVTTKKRKRRK